MSEFNLSEKIMYQMGDEELSGDEVITIDDVKEFIRLLKERIERLDWSSDFTVHDIIDALAGEKLI